MSLRESCTDIHPRLGENYEIQVGHSVPSGQDLTPAKLDIETKPLQHQHRDTRSSYGALST